MAVELDFDDFWDHGGPRMPSSADMKSGFMSALMQGAKAAQELEEEQIRAEIELEIAKQELLERQEAQQTVHDIVAHIGPIAAAEILSKQMAEEGVIWVSKLD